MPKHTDISSISVIASAAKQSRAVLRRSGLLRCARNDGWMEVVVHRVNKDSVLTSPKDLSVQPLTVQNQQRFESRFLLRAKLRLLRFENPQMAEFSPAFRASRTAIHALRLLRDRRLVCDRDIGSAKQKQRHAVRSAFDRIQVSHSHKLARQWFGQGCEYRYHSHRANQ